LLQDFRGLKKFGLGCVTEAQTIKYLYYQILRTFRQNSVTLQYKSKIKFIKFYFGNNIFTLIKQYFLLLHFLKYNFDESHTKHTF